MVAASVSGPDAKRSFAAFVAGSSEGLRREVRAEVRRRGLPPGVDVDDVVQTAFAKLLPVYDRLASEFAAFNYAHKTAMHTLTDARRRDRVRHEGWLESVYRRHHRATADPEEEALRGLRAADVRRAFRGLPLSQRRALALVDVEELRQSDAADVLGVSQTALKGLVQRGRARLRQDLIDVPGIAALLRLRRSVVAPAAVAPGVAMMAALVLTVTNAPAVPARTPHVAMEAGSRPVAAAAAGPVARSVARPARPAPGPRTKPAAVARRAAPAAEKPAGDTGKRLPATGAGACVGDTCAGDLGGDRVCVASSRKPVCVAQYVVGVCPAIDRVHPLVTCTRDTEPMLEPLPDR